MNGVLIILIVEVAFAIALLISDSRTLSAYQTVGKLIIAIDETDKENPYVFMEFDIPLDELDDGDMVLAKIVRKNIQ